MLRVRACFQLRPDRPSPQSQSPKPIFSWSYGSGLPTSLTYIVLSTRGCSPWRPAAVMGTIRGESLHSSPGFSGAGQCNTGRCSRRSALRGRGAHFRSSRFQANSPLQRKENSHYENLSLKMTLKNHSYSEIQYYIRKCCTENFSVLFKCNFQRCFCLT